MNTHLIKLKHVYSPPKVISVTFRVEDAFVSNTNSLLFIPLGAGSTRGTEDFTSIANSGSSFWGGSSEVDGSGNEGYSSFEWDW